MILVAMAAWLVHRWLHPVRVAPGYAFSFERSVALATHRLFYVILLIGPFLGWAAASARGVPVRLHATCQRRPRRERIPVDRHPVLLRAMELKSRKWPALQGRM